MCKDISLCHLLTKFDEFLCSHCVFQQRANRLATDLRYIKHKMIAGIARLLKEFTTQALFSQLTLFFCLEAIKISGQLNIMSITFLKKY